MMDFGRSLSLALFLVASLCVESCVYVPAGYPGPYYGPPIPGYYRRPPYGPHRRAWQPGDGYPADEALAPKPDNAEAPPPKDLPIPGAASAPPGSDAPRDHSQAESRSSTNSAPTAVRVPNRPTRVKSPFPPYGELDVTGLPSGSLAKDPVSGKVFKIP